MENLNKQQLILLALLVSFVTSIATGIVTVALMSQAPVGITQTINRVVEKTIETVTTPSNTVVKETTVVSSDDQVVNSINKNSNSVIRVYRANTDPTTGGSMAFVGLGVVVSDDGLVATDNSLISEGGKYITTSGSDKIHDLSITRAIAGEQIALLQIVKDDKNPINVSKVPLASSDIKLGQTVIYIGGETKNMVSTGIVSSLSTIDIKPSDNSTSTPIKTRISAIETSMSPDNILGGILLNLSGELVGIKSTFMDSSKTNLFVPVSYIQDDLAAITAAQKKTQ